MAARATSARPYGPVTAAHFADSKGELWSEPAAESDQPAVHQRLDEGIGPE